MEMRTQLRTLMVSLKMNQLAYGPRKSCECMFNLMNGVPCVQIVPNFKAGIQLAAPILCRDFEALCDLLGLMSLNGRYSYILYM